MTARISTALRNALVGSLGFTGAMCRGYIGIYTGSQPATADSAATGTLLGKVTAASAALTQETPASQTITVAGSSGSINTVTVGTLNIIPDGAVAFRTDASTTASDLCDAINRNGYMRASVVGAVVTVSSRPGAGTTHNGLALATTVTTLTATSGGNMTGGVASANGLILSAPSSGVISKLSTQVWSFAGIATGTAGWARFYGAQTDDGSTSSTVLCRLDGSVATSGGDFALSNINVTVGAPNTIDLFTWTQNAQ